MPPPWCALHLTPFPGAPAYSLVLQHNPGSLFLGFLCGIVPTPCCLLFSGLWPSALPVWLCLSWLLLVHSLSLHSFHFSLSLFCFISTRLPFHLALRGCLLLVFFSISASLHPCLSVSQSLPPLRLCASLCPCSDSLTPVCEYVILFILQPL